MIKTNNFGVWIKVFRVNFDYFAMNILIGGRDSHPLMRIMALPNKGLTLR